MPAIGKITLDIKDYEAKLAQARKEGERFARSASKNAGTASAGMNNFGKSVSKAGGLLGSLGSAAGSSLGSLGSVISSIASGPVVALTAAFGALVSLGVSIWDRMTLSAEEYAKKLDLISQQADKKRASMEKQSAEDSGYMSRLQELADKERLSNEAKTEAASLIQMLNSRYGDLGISIDQVTGKISGMDEAQKRFIERQKQMRMQVLQDQLNATQSKVMNQGKQATSAMFIADRWLGGSKDAQKITKSVLGNDKLDIDKKIEYATTLRDEVKTEDEMNKWQAVIDSLEKVKELRKQIQMLQDTGSTTEKEHAVAMQKETEKSQKKEDFLSAEKESLEIQKMINEGRTEEAKALKLINEMKKQGVKLSKEEAAAIIKKRQEVASQTYYKDTIQDLENQIQIQQMINDGMDEEAKRQAIINDLKKRGLAYDEDSVNRIMELNRQLGALKLEKSQKDEKNSLYNRALRMAGRSQEAEEREALDRARKTKGSDLTDDEKQKTLELLNLSRQLDDLQKGPNFGDLSIKTNDLTRRGGFQGAAVVPDTDKYNRSIDQTNKTILNILQRLDTTIREYGKF